MPVNIIRSPAYPSMSLSDAIEKVGRIERVYRNANVDREAAVKLLGYSGLSGPSNKALSALAHYGLVKRAGKGQMRITARAKAILHSDTESEKRQNLRDAAFEPDLFRELQERFPGITSPREGVETFLNRKGFNLTAVRPAAQAYLDTLLFLEQASAIESHGAKPKVDADSGASGGDGERQFGGAQVGDLIQWEIGGVLQMEAPMRVRLVSEVGGRPYVAVEGSETGIPMDQVVVEERPKPEIEAPRFKIEKLEDNAPKLGMRKAMFPLDDGDVTLIFPESISADGLGDLADYLDIFLKKEQRNKAQ